MNNTYGMVNIYSNRSETKSIGLVTVEFKGEKLRYTSNDPLAKLCGADNTKWVKFTRMGGSPGEKYYAAKLPTGWTHFTIYEKGKEIKF